MTETSFSSFAKRLWQRRLVRYLLPVVLAVFAFFLLLPVGSKYYLRQWLLDNGADSAAIGKIRINPLTGRLFIENVRVTRNGRTVLANSTVFVNLGLRAMFDREALLQKATLTDTIVDIERYDDSSIRIGSYRTAPPDGRPNGKEEGVPWVFRARNVGFSDVLIRYVDSDLRLDLHVEEATAKRFSTDPQGAAGSLELSGTLNEAPIKLHLPLVKFAPDLHLEGDLECSGFPFGALAGLFKDDLTGLQGNLSLATALMIDNGGTGLTATLQGKIGLAEVSVRGSGWTGSGSIALDGGLGYLASETGKRIAVDGRLMARPVAFAMPAKKLSLNEPELTLEAKTAINIDKAVTVDSDGRLSLSDARIRGETLAADAGPGSWSGTIRYDSGEVKEPASFIADGSLDLRNLTLSLPGAIQWRHRQLSARGKVELSAAEPLAVGYRGNLELVDADLAAPDLGFGGEKFSWQGEADYLAGESDGSGNLKLAGSLKAERPAVDLKQENFGFLAGSLAIDSNAEISFGENWEYRGTAALAATTVDIAEANNPLGQVGTITVDRIGGDHGSLSIDRVRVDNIQLIQSARVPARVSIDWAELSGAAGGGNLEQVTFDRLALGPSSTAMNDATGTIARIDLEGSTLRALQEMEARHLRIENGTLSLDTAGPPLVTFSRAHASPLIWSAAGGTRIDGMDLDSLTLRYRKEQEPAQPPAESPAAGEQAGEENRAIPLRIDRIEVGGDSTLHYTDASLDPAFQISVAVNSLTLSPVDLNRPEQPIGYELSAMVDKYAPLTLSGSFTPLAAPFSLKQRATLQNYSLQSLSPFAVEAVGLALKSGQLDLTSEMTVTGEQVDSRNQLVIKNLEIAKRDEAQAQRLAANLPVPMDFAIDILSDRKGVIDISVPVEGKLSDLRFNIQGIVINTLNKAIMAGIAPALAYTALGPTGALVYLGMQIGRSLLDTGLPSLGFFPNTSELSAGQKSILDKVGATLREKMADEKKTYSICPRVVPGETGEPGESALTVEEERKELYRLGERRAQAVKSYLLEKFRLDGDRLFICNPAIDYGGSRGTVEFRE